MQASKQNGINTIDTVLLACLNLCNNKRNKRIQYISKEQVQQHEIVWLLGITLMQECTCGLDCDDKSNLIIIEGVDTLL